MNYKAAYLHMFNKLTNLTAQLETLEDGWEQINILRYLKELQLECEEVCIGGVEAGVCRASRHGGTGQ